MTQNDKQEWKKLYIYSIQLVRVYILYAIYIWGDLLRSSLAVSDDGAQTKKCKTTWKEQGRECVGCKPGPGQGSNNKNNNKNCVPQRPSIILSERGKRRPSMEPSSSPSSLSPAMRGGMQRGRVGLTHHRAYSY